MSSDIRDSTPTLSGDFQTCDCGTPMVLNRSWLNKGTNTEDPNNPFDYEQEITQWVCPACTRTLTGPVGAPVSSR